MNQVPIVQDICTTCAGPIYAQRNVLSTRYTGSWLHLHAADWHENPHPAIPAGYHEL